jgi:DNA-binding transcriptional ArsR family regulator
MVVDNASNRSRPSTRTSTVSDEQADLLFHALADATRRDIVRLVMVGEQSVSALASRYPFSFAAVQKHVAVLERAGLVVKRKVGREQLVGGQVDAVQRAARLLDELEALWRGRLDRFADVLHEQFPTAPDTQQLTQEGTPE